MEDDFFLLASCYEGFANGDPELIQVKKDALLLGDPIGRDHGDNPHPSPDPRVGNVLPLHIRLPCSSPAPAEYQKPCFGASAQPVAYSEQRSPIPPALENPSLAGYRPARSF